ncbi:peroxisomal biogenesis factor 14 [Tachypleus tridentatus]|uniref:peroxisomal biogenesis factor 14 n=1 Tax=Tachypleus tridentatus TaxID=6853 RepID=UPI003FD00F6A
MEEKEKETVNEVVDVNDAKSSNQNEEINKDGSQEAKAPRENLIATAIHFLRSPKVKASPLSQKRAFLIKKGLTDEEIDFAIERAGIDRNDAFAYNRPGEDPLSLQPKTVMPLKQGNFQPDLSVWQKWQTFYSGAVLIGITCYGVYYIYKTYVRPWLLGIKEEDRISRVEQQLCDMNDSLSQLRHSLLSVETHLSQQVKKLSSLEEQKEDASVKNILTLNEIKSEVTSLKALLLSRGQFPTAPVTKPGIPSWQLDRTKGEELNKEAALNGPPKNDKELESSMEIVNGGVVENVTSVESADCSPDSVSNKISGDC